MSDNSAYKKVTLAKPITLIDGGRTREKGTVMSFPLDVVRRMEKEGLIKVTKKWKTADEPIKLID